MVHLIRSASLTNYVDVARSFGLDPYRHLAAAGIQRSALLDPDLKIPTTAVARLLEASAQAAGVEDFGLRMAETRQVSNLGALVLVAREEPTLRRAIAAMTHYLRLQNEALVFSLEEADGIAIIRHELIGARGVPLRQSMQLVLGVVHRMLASLLDTAWRPRSVCFTDAAPASTATYARVFGTSVAFRQDFDGLVCLASDLDAALPSYDPVLASQSRRYLDAKLAQSQASVVDKVRALVFALLPTGDCSIERIAQHLGVEARTVQRQLASHDAHYSAILDGVRMELAQRHVATGRERPLSEVATLLGFSSLSAFSRWFTGRFGCSVSKFRAGDARMVVPGRTA